MSVYEIPVGDGDGDEGRRSGRRAAPVPPAAPEGEWTFPAPAPDASAYLNAPPPAFPPSSELPPPPAFPAPPAFEAPAAYPAPPAYPEPAAFPAPPYEPPAFEAPSFDAAAFPASAYEPPPAYPESAAFPAPAYEPPAFEVPSFPTPAYEPPPFDLTTAFDAPPTFDPVAAAAFEASMPPAPALSPYTEAPALPATSSMPVGVPQFADAAPYPMPMPMAPDAPVVTEVIDRSPQPGEGQEGSDPELVRALNAVVTSGGSDLHISEGTPPMIRVDGGLRNIEGFEVWSHGRVSDALQSILTDDQQEALTIDLELDFAYGLSDSARFRVNMYWQRNHLGAAFRLIPTQIKPLTELGIPERVSQFAQLPRGLVLVTGPTGSGKSTTLAALIDLVNETRSDHIVTVEDPIEFMHENKRSLVSQREVGADTHSFQAALKHVLRQDPDVILIGELRDLETISVALTAAETGHLVFATLHTQDAPQSIDRILDVFPSHQQAMVRTQLAGTLQGIVSQTLVKKVGGGRAVATEVLVTTPAISNVIREGKVYQIHSMMQSGRDLGMHTMDQHLADLVNAGQISHQAASDKAQNLEDLKQLIRRGQQDADTGGYSAEGML
jgi:twitching motility protein PilT